MEETKTETAAEQPIPTCPYCGAKPHPLKAINTVIAIVSVMVIFCGKCGKTISAIPVGMVQSPLATPADRIILR